MNRLNLFHLYSQDEGGNPIENNLSRALAICLKSDALFLSEFIRYIVEKHSNSTSENLSDLFSISNNKSAFDIQVHKETRGFIEDDKEPEIVFAIAMSTRDFDMTGFSQLSMTKGSNERNIGDIIIRLNNALFIIEVKKSPEDCRQQLFNQVSFISNKEVIVPVSFSWEQVLGILLRIRNIHFAVGHLTSATNDLIQLLDSFYSDWFPPRPFTGLTFNPDMQSVEGKRLQRRLYQSMEQVKLISKKSIRYFADRTVFAVDLPWAKEIQPCFLGEGTQHFLALYIWPANTKGQGYPLYRHAKGLDWTHQKQLKIGDQQFPLNINYEVKFCHFNRFIAHITYEDPSELKKPLHTPENFEETGEYSRTTWPDLEKWLDSHFQPEFNWRKAVDWQNNFVDSDRTYLTISLGFEVSVLIPYSKLQELDKKESDYKKIAELLLAGIESVQQTIT